MVTTVTGYTAERMKAIEDAAIVDGDVNGSGHLILSRYDGTTIDAGSVIGPTGAQGPPGTDPSIVICTSTTRPTGVDLFEGLVIYETDTKMMYVYNASSWVYLVIGPTGRFVAVKVPATLFTVSSTTGVDWNASDPFDYSITKKHPASISVVYLRVAWSGYHVTAGPGWGNSQVGVKIAGVNYWCMRPHQINLAMQHFEHTDVIGLVGFPAGTINMRAVIRVAAGGQVYTADIADFFRIEHEEVLI